MATSSPAISGRLRDRRFYLFVTILTAAMVFAGFARTFFLNGFFAKLHLPSLFIVHGIVFSSWLVLLVTQSALVSVKQIRIHQKLGYTSIAILVSMFTLGWIMYANDNHGALAFKEPFPYHPHITLAQGLAPGAAKPLYEIARTRWAACKFSKRIRAAHASFVQPGVSARG